MNQLLDETKNFLGIRNFPRCIEKSGVVVVPVPFEQSSSFGRGSEKGPEEILKASHHVELFDAQLGFSPLKNANGIITTQPFTEGSSGQYLAKNLETEISYWLNTEKHVVTLGGEHTSVVGAIKAHSEYYDNLTILQLDAHSDLRSTYQNDPWNHACTMARVLDFHSDIVQVGIRSQSKTEKKKSSQLGLTVFYAEDIHEREGNGIDWISEVINSLSEKVYISFDCDVMDPSIIPATGTPEPGGLSWFQTHNLLNRISQTKHIVGFDVSELAPINSIHYPQFTIAKLVYRLIGYMYRLNNSI